MTREKRDAGISHAFSGPLAFVDLAPLDRPRSDHQVIHWEGGLIDDEKTGDDEIKLASLSSA